MSLKSWILALRLRTLPLAISNISMGSILAAFAGIFSWSIWVLSVVTAVLLQILSNLSNDYGDSIHGADHSERKGPKRVVQTGAISKRQMLIAMVITAIAALISGILLIFASLQSWTIATVFLFLGLLAIWAAVRYTAGDQPYGYRGLGDIFVFVFFGIVAVGGSFYLQTKSIDWTVLLPAASCGLFSMGVLNVNNIRDIESDQLAGKSSIPVMIGRKRAVVYHQVLLFFGLLCALIYMLIHFSTVWQFIFLLILPLLLKNIQAVRQFDDAMQLDPYLKQMALANLLFVITFAIGLYLAY